MRFIIACLCIIDCCFTSCVNQKINVVQQVSQTALRQKYGAEHKNTFAYNPPISKPNNAQNNLIPKKRDSVKITTKSNVNYYGKIEGSDYSGYSISTAYKTIYISNNEIKKIDFYKDSLQPINKKNSITISNKNEDYYVPSTPKEASPVVETELNSIISLLASVLGFVFFPSFVVSIIFGIRSLNKIGEYPEKYKGKAMAIIGITISSIVILLIASVIILFLSMVI